MPRQFRSDDTSIWEEKFGTGINGSKTVSSSETFQVATSVFSTDGNAYGVFTGTSGNTSGSVSDAYGFWTTYVAVGDYVLIHQTYGTGAGAWELNVVTGGIPGAGGSGTLTLKYPLQNNYSAGCQIIKCPQFTDFTINNGVSVTTRTLHNATFGGISALFVNGTMTINGSFSGSEKGFAGGVSDNYNGYQGDSSTTISNAATTVKNGAGGGGGAYGNGRMAGGGGGGGNGTAGTAGQPGDSGSGQGGDTDGNAELTSLAVGAGGGSGGWRSSSTTTVGSGGIGGAGLFIFARNLIVNGNIYANGQNGGTRNGTASSGAGGGGAGGSILIKSENATLGSSLITATGGAGGFQGIGNDGGPGGTGRIHIDYALSFTGTTNPTIDSRQDTSLGSGGGSFLYLLV